MRYKHDGNELSFGYPNASWPVMHWSGSTLRRRSAVNEHPPDRFGPECVGSRCRAIWRRL